MLAGYMLCDTCLPAVKNITKTTFSGKPIRLSSVFVFVPASFLTGTIGITWCVYLLASILSSKGVEQALLTADAIVLAAATVCFFVWFWWKKRTKSIGMCLSELYTGIQKHGITAGEWGFLVLLLILIVQMMFRTFFIWDNTLYVGLSVFSDFAPHLGMIRSFSYSDNFPTSYAHFAGEDIRYHFLFQFLVGNLEKLGMRLDFAFNLPSIAGLLFACILLYVLAVKLSGRRLCGYFATAFFLFRSSPSFFKFVAEQPKGTLWDALKNQIEFISYTQNESWGLWNLNVYCNQRHFAFAIAVLLLALLYFMPYLYCMAEKLKQRCCQETAAIQKEKHGTDFTEDFIVLQEEEQKTDRKKGCKRNGAQAKVVLKTFLKTCFFTKTAFAFYDWKGSLVLGIVLGGMAFFNGSVLIACLSMLFFMAAFSEYRLDYLLTAVTALVLSLAESALFVDGAAVSPQFYFGFLADNKTIAGSLAYMWDLWGILGLFVIAALFFDKGVRRYLIVIFSGPLLLAFTVSLTPDVTVNHKFVMLSAMLLSIYPAMVVVRLLEHKRLSCRILAVLLSFVLVATGVFDYCIVYRRNNPAYALTYSQEDALTLWIKENADADDIILSSWYHLHPVVLGGGMLYYGWPYYAWSAGYDTAYRESMVIQMYEAETSEELDNLVKQENIRYIIVDRECRESTLFQVREDVIANTYEVVYTEGDGDWLLSIYDVTKKK